MMTRESFWGTVFAAYMLGGIVFSSCSNEMMEVNDGVSTFAEWEDEELIYSLSYSKFTFILWAYGIQDNYAQDYRIRDLYDVRISIAPLSLGDYFDTGGFNIEFKTDPEGRIPSNFVEVRYTNCHYYPDAVNMPTASSPITDIVLTDGVFNRDIYDRVMRKGLVVIQLNPKSYVTNIFYKPRLIVARVPLALLCQMPSACDDTMYIQTYFDCNENLFFNSMEFDADNPPVYMFEPNGYARILFKDGTERMFYGQEKVPLPSYDGGEYFLDAKVEEFRNLPDTSQYPFKDYYKQYMLVPPFYPLYYEQQE